MVWHQCPIHRTDPPEHQAKKADKKALQNKEPRATSKEDKKLKLQSSKRKAPEVSDEDPFNTKAKSRRRTAAIIHEYQPKVELLQRIKLKEGRSKESSVVEVEAADASKAAAGTRAKCTCPPAEVHFASGHHEVGEVATIVSQEASKPCRGKSNGSQSNQPTKAAESKPILTRASLKRALELQAEEH